MQEGDLKCALCLDFFTAPVHITNCGHNYCQQCLTGKFAAPWSCPECRTEQHQRPEQLIRNFVFEKIIGNYIASRKNICAAHNLQKKLRKYLIFIEECGILNAIFIKLLKFYFVF